MADLPFRTDVSQLKRQAKELLRKARAGDPDAVARITSVHADLTLSAAQLAVARSYGHRSWPDLITDAGQMAEAKSEAGWQSRASFGDGWFEEEWQTEREVQHYAGSCRECGACWAFETNVVRGFADHIEAHCPKCGATLGTFREDLLSNINVRLDEDATPKTYRESVGEAVEERLVARLKEMGQ